MLAYTRSRSMSVIDRKATVSGWWPLAADCVRKTIGHLKIDQGDRLRSAFFATGAFKVRTKP